MAQSENHLRWKGNAGADAKKVEFNGGSFYVIPVAATKYIRGRTGGEDHRQETTWLDVVVFQDWLRDTAKNIKKGDKVIAHGELQVRESESNGVKYKNYSLRAHDIDVGVRFEKPKTETQKPAEPAMSMDEIPF